MAVLGIDPGKTGALALIPDNKGAAEVYDYPGDPVGLKELLLAILAEHQVDLAAIEQQQAMPKQGVTSTFKLGENFGTWVGLLVMAGVPLVLVRPQQWRKGLGLRAAEGKNAALFTARRLFPEADLSLKRHHGRADALLIADWARRRCAN